MLNLKRFLISQRTLLASLAAFFGFGFIFAQNPDPRSLTIYQVMVASFQHHTDGGPGYNAMWGPDGHRKNGNIKGVTAALDHIKGLGANAIWLTPIFDSSNAAGGEKLQATGYFTNNFFEIDPHFGTADDLHELVEEAHKRGIYVFLDGVFGHHGGVVQPSPSGHTIDSTRVLSDRGKEGGEGNIKYPESLPYMTEVATYWIDNFDIDGWRLDQAYQAMQNGHNYWKEIRRAIDKLTERRKSEGKEWGTLGYLVGEDWGDHNVINKGVYKNGGLISAFDFEGKALISGEMQEPQDAGLHNGWDDVVTIFSTPKQRGYLNNRVMPNLYLSNHDGYRLADRFPLDDPQRWAKMKLRHAILAAYSGPITLYYGDEFGDRSLETTGAQKDNIARTTGHIEPNTTEEADLAKYVSHVMELRNNNPAMWRGTCEFDRLENKGADILVVTKTDTESGNKVKIYFSDKDTTLVTTEGEIKLEALIPLFQIIN